MSGEKSSAMKQVLIRMPREMHEAIRAEAERQDRTIAAEVRRALRAYLNAPPASSRGHK